MKKVLSVIFIASLLFSACGDNASKDKEKNDSTEISDKDSKRGEAKDCDEFIDQYEEWMDDYIELIEKYMKNPMDAELMTEYMKLAQEGMTWINQWNGKLYYCSAQEKYQERFDEISEKAEKKLKELGID